MSEIAIPTVLALYVLLHWQSVSGIAGRASGTHEKYDFASILAEYEIVRLNYGGEHVMNR
jgi:hypothetical protein